MQLIMHIDMDSFYASVEMRENPKFKDIPLIIGAEPKEGRGRGVVLTCNYPARKFGIHSAMPISQAYKKCPHAVFLLPRMELYFEVSQRIMELLKMYGNRVEQVSVDEAFIDVSDRVDNFEEARIFAISIKEDIRQKEGLTCSIGIAENKLIAKMCSDMNKPDGISIIKPEKIAEFLIPLPVEKIPGIGPKSREILESVGIRTIGEIRKYSSDSIIRLFGENRGRWLYECSYGIDNGPVEETYSLKSVNRNFTFETDTDDIRQLHDTLAMLTQEVYEYLNENNISYKTITLRVRYDNFETFTRAKSLPEHSNKIEQIIDTCTTMLDGFLGKRKIRQLGVRLSNLGIMDKKQRSILEF